MKIGLPAYTWMLEIGAFFIGTETEIILGSTYAYPEKVLNEGFTFKYKTMQACLDNL
jgi:NAD dependent epimerase/dehydratase family enzyme